MAEDNSILEMGMPSDGTAPWKREYVLEHLSDFQFPRAKDLDSRYRGREHRNRNKDDPQEGSECRKTLTLDALFEFLPRKASPPLTAKEERMRPYGEKFYGEKYLHKTISLLADPLHDLDAINKRLELVRYFTNAYGERGGKTVKLMKQLISNHSHILNTIVDEYNEGFTNTAIRFAKIASAFSELEQILSKSQITAGFAKEIKFLINGHKEIFERAYGFERKSRVMIRSNFDVYLALPSIRKSDAISLGLFDYPPRESEHPRCTDPYYPGSERDCQRMKKFVIDSAAVVYLLGSFYYLASACKYSKSHSIDFCIPEINKQGIFEVSNAQPVSCDMNSAAVPFDFHYDRNDRHVILSGAHSGGKTALLKNIGLYHILALSGLPVPAKKARVPLVDSICTLFEKDKNEGQGALESELKQASYQLSCLGENDLWLIDEFLDTTKPELAKYLEEPFLRDMAKSPAAIILVSHRAANIPDDIKFRFLHPELKEREREIREGDEFTGDVFPTGTKKKFLAPTHKFLEGKPDPEMTRKHAQMMWERMSDKKRGIHW
jgi:hypothetical protein